MGLQSTTLPHVKITLGINYGLHLKDRNSELMKEVAITFLIYNASAEFFFVMGS
jgi:hypothetical protein